MAITALYIFIFSFPLESAIRFEGGATWSRLIGLFLFAIWIFDRGVKRKSLHDVLNVYYLIPVVMIICLALVSGMWSEYDVRLTRIVTLIQLLLMSIIVVDLSTSWKRVQMALSFLVLGGLVAVGVIFYQFFILHSYRAGAELAGGINETATFLVILIPFSFYVFQESESKIWRSIGFLYLITSPLAVIITFSRAAYALLILALLLQFKGMFKSQTRGFLYFVAFSLIIIAFLFDFLPFEYLLKRVEIFSQFVTGASLATMQVESSRIYIYHLALAIWSDHLLIGVGFGNFGHQFLQYQNNFMTSSIPKFYTNPGLSPHSTFLGILAELGLVGLLILGWVLWKGFRTIIQVNENAKGLPSTQKMFVQVLFYSFFICVFNGLVNVIHTDKIFWFLLGFIEVARRLIKEFITQQHIPNKKNIISQLKDE
jgi:O-antigen ligase